MVLRQTVMATHHSAQTSKTREAAALPKSAYGASRPLARVPAKVPSLNAPAVTQTWWCEPLLMPRCGRWCRSPPSRRGSAITTAASRSRPGQSAAGPARLFRCPHLSSPRRGGLVPHALSPGRQGSPDPLTPAAGHSAAAARSASVPRFYPGHKRDQYRSHQELSAPANNRWLSGCVVARAGFPCAL